MNMALKLIAASLILASCGRENSPPNASDGDSQPKPDETTSSEVGVVPQTGPPILAGQFAGIIQLASANEVRVYFNNRGAVDHTSGTIEIDGLASTLSPSPTAQYLSALLPVGVRVPVSANVTLSSKGAAPQEYRITLTEVHDAAPEPGLPADLRMAINKLQTAIGSADRDHFVALTSDVVAKSKEYIQTLPESDQEEFRPLRQKGDDAVAAMRKATESGDGDPQLIVDILTNDLLEPLRRYAESSAGD